MSAAGSSRGGEAAKADHSEISRQLVHMSMGGFALLLRWMAWWQALALAVAALAFNLFVLPRIAPRLYRPGDRARGLHGIVYYPLAVCLLIVAFPARPDIVAAAWGILAAGDGIATIAGRAIGGPRWPWNREKTLAGSAAFAAGGATAGVLLAWWCRPAVADPPSLMFVIAAPVAAAIVAALVETIPVRLDDNLSVAAAGGATLYLASLGSRAAFDASAPLVAARLPIAFFLNLILAAAAHLAGSVSLSGALAGALIGVTIYASIGLPGWLLLFVTFVAASIASRLGLERKTLLGIAEDRGGRRGAGNAIANTGLAAVAALLAVTTPYNDAARLAFAAALTAGGSDTIASEVGKAFGRRTFSITSFTRVPPGTSGAMSLEGTLAGLAGAIGLGAAAVWLGVVPDEALFPIAAGATAGSLLESWLGATLEGPGYLNNDMLNFVNTAAGAVAALAIASVVR